MWNNERNNEMIKKKKWWEGRQGRNCEKQKCQRKKEWSK